MLPAGTGRKRRVFVKGAKMDGKHKVIAATQRSDGSWRKPVRVRKGFDPMSLPDPLETVSANRCEDGRSDGSEPKSEESAAGRSSGHTIEDVSRHSSKETVNSSTGSRPESVGKGTTEESEALKRLLNSGPLDPFASCCNFVEAGGFDVFTATVASNVANEDRILIDPVRHDTLALFALSSLTWPRAGSGALRCF
jgi:hypothetical protein